MLLFARCFGVATETLLITVDPSENVSVLVDHLGKLRPRWEVRRLLFAGAVLNRELPFSDQNVEKESTIQVMCVARPPKDDDDAIPARELLLARQTTEEDIAFGDVLLVDVISGSHLVARDSWSGTSDPYVIAAIASQQVTTSVKKQTLNPNWNETCLFFVEKPAEWEAQGLSLTLQCWDRDFLTPDDPLGHVELPFLDIPREGDALTGFHQLQGVEHGSLLLSVRRYPILSPDMREAVRKLAHHKTPLKSSRLRKVGTTLDELRGLPFPAASNDAESGNEAKRELSPALAHLSGLLVDGRVQIRNTRTASKVRVILAAHGLLPLLNSSPSRFLWLCVGRSDTLSMETVADLPGLKHVNNIGPHGRVLSTVFVSEPLAVLALIGLHQRGDAFRGGVFFPDHGSHKNMIEGFHHFGLVDVAATTSTEEEHRVLGDFSRAWLLVRQDGKRLQCFFTVPTSQQNDGGGEPAIDVPLDDQTIVRVGPWTIELLDKTENNNNNKDDSFVIRVDSVEEADDVFERLHALRTSAVLARAKDDVPTAECTVCKGRKELGSLFRTESFLSQPAFEEQQQWTCLACLRDAVAKTLDEGRAHTLSSQFSVLDLRDICDEQLFERYERAHVQDLLTASNERVTTCPECKTQHLLAFHTWASREQVTASSVLSGKMGMDGKPLSGDAKRHFVEHRVFCRGCYASFCSVCERSPYHIGFAVCEDYVAWQAAPQCRFCPQRLLSELDRQHELPGFDDVCVSCAHKAKHACNERVEPCGHPCGHHKTHDDRSEHLCLLCSDDMAHEMCGICACELYESPVVRLQSCSHTFHAACVRRAIEKGWSGARISFNFMDCPYCKTRMTHPFLKELQRPLRELELQVLDLALKRFYFEGLNNEPIFTEPQVEPISPKAWAMDHFSFSLCHECKRPYFTGARECDAGDGDELVPEDLVCGSCAAAALSQRFECEHGDAFLVYKCKYCCSIATYFCWDKVHFCSSCHKYERLMALCKSGSGVNRLDSLADYAQCGNLQERMKQLRAKMQGKSSKDAIDEALAKLMSNASECPLGLNHPPNGVEHCLGCGQCQAADPESKEVDATATDWILEGQRLMIAAHPNQLSSLHIPPTHLVGSDIPKDNVQRRTFVVKGRGGVSFSLTFRVPPFEQLFSASLVVFKTWNGASKEPVPLKHRIVRVRRRGPRQDQDQADPDEEKKEEVREEEKSVVVNIPAGDAQRRLTFDVQPLLVDLEPGESHDVSLRLVGDDPNCWAFFAGMKAPLDQQPRLEIEILTTREHKKKPHK